MRWLLFLFPVLGLAQSTTGGAHGRAASGVSVRLAAVDHSQIQDARIDAQGRFRFEGLPPGWYVLAAAKNQSNEIVRAIRIESGKDADLGELKPGSKAGTQEPVQVMTVCEALARPTLPASPVIVVGIFKSGMDQTLRQDCKDELVSGEVAWPDMIALTNSAEAPDSFRPQIDKKKAELFASYPPEAKPRPERLVGLYGILVRPDGFVNKPCCHSAAETDFAPARLFGIGEKDRRVIR